MKPKDEVHELWKATAPMAEFGSYLAGYRAAERRCLEATQIWGIALFAFVMGMTLVALTR